MNFPPPFSGCRQFVALPDQKTLANFVTSCLSGQCIDEAGQPVYHGHNFAVDTDHRRVFGSELLMGCVQRWMEVHGDDDPG